MNWAYCIMTEAVIVTLFGLILTLVRKFCKRPPLILLLLGLVSAVAGSGVLFGLNYSDRYHLCILTGMFGLFLALWTGFAAMTPHQSIRTANRLQQLAFWRKQNASEVSVSYQVVEQGSWKRFVLLAVSAIGTVITAGLCVDFSSGISAISAVPERDSAFGSADQCRLLSCASNCRSSGDHVV